MTMSNSYIKALSSAFMVAALSLPCSGTTVGAPAPSSEEAPKSFVSHHRIRIHGATMPYTAIAGETLIRDMNNDATASIFSFSYLKDGKAADRPVTFVFNGGPGSSSLWLHMGVLGPRRLELDRDPDPTPVPPYRSVSNEFCPLDVTDIVFIDPVGTGFSRALGAHRAESFYGVDEDAASIAEFIETWLTVHHRWNSPKFLIGESYGTARAAVLTRVLMGGPTNYGLMRGVAIDGVVLLGTLLDARDGDGTSQELQVATGLPNLADTAWYNHKVDARGLTLPQFDAEVRKFAMERYYPALQAAAAGKLSEADTQKIAVDLSRYTGISTEQLISAKLVLEAGPFTRQLLSDRGLQLGLYDSRYTLPLIAGGDPVADDPAMARYTPAFISTFHDMLDADLNVVMPANYRAIVWHGLLDHWKWSRAGVPKGQDFAVDLALSMRSNPHLRVLVASGYFDLATHPLAAEILLRKAGAPVDRLSFVNYPAGHMIYVGPTAQTFADDLRAFISKSAVSGPHL